MEGCAWGRGGAMRPKGACSASLHCVGIAPYGGVQGVRACNGSPSVKASRCHLTEGGGEFRAAARGETDSHASDIGHWLGMTRQGGRL